MIDNRNGKGRKKNEKIKGELTGMILWSILRLCSFKDDVFRAKDAFPKMQLRITNYELRLKTRGFQFVIRNS